MTRVASDPGRSPTRGARGGGRERRAARSAAPEDSPPAPNGTGGFFCGSGQVAQLVEHVTENHGVGGSIPSLAMEKPDRMGRVRELEVRSSTGRAPVSKTGGWGFESLRACAGQVGIAPIV